MAIEATLQLIQDTLLVLVPMVMLGSILVRIRSDIRTKGGTSKVKFLIMVAFILEIYSGIINLPIIRGGLIPETFYPSTDEGIGLGSAQTGAVVVLGMVLVFYLFGWERLLYMPIYLYGAIIFYFLISGLDDIFPVFVYAGGIFALVMLYIASFKMRENNALGLTVFYTISFGDIIISPMMAEGALFPYFYSFILYTFGIIYALGLFKPFKEVTTPEAKGEDNSQELFDDGDQDNEIKQEAKIVTNLQQEVS